MVAKFVTPLTEGRRNYVDGVGLIARAQKTPLMPWQRQLAALQTELNDSGDGWAYSTVVASVPRQAGKTTVRGPIAVHRCLLIPRARTWFTAQTRQDARDTIVEEAAPRFKASPFGQLATLRRSAGSEGLYFRSGSYWRAFAPNEDALHGKANHLVDVDEPWSIDLPTGVALEQAIYPTFTTTGGQFGMISTAGHAGSTWFRGYIDAGREAVAADRRSGTALLEYGLAEDMVDDVRAGLMHEPDSPAWLEAVWVLIRDHPAYGYTLKPDAVIGPCRKMSPDDILRAYGNVWTDAVETLFAPHVWAMCATRSAGRHPRPGIGVAADPDRADFAIAEAWRDITGRPHGRIRHHQPGLTGAAEQLLEHYRPGRTACSATGPALEVVDHLEQDPDQPGIRIQRISDPDYCTASAQVLTAVLEAVAVLEQHPALDAAARSAGRKHVGDRWRFDRKPAAGATVTALEALTLALWQYDHAPAQPAEPAVASA